MGISCIGTTVESIVSFDFGTGRIEKVLLGCSHVLLPVSAGSLGRLREL